MHQFGWISERTGQLLQFASEREGLPQKKGGGGGVSNLGEIYGKSYIKDY